MFWTRPLQPLTLIAIFTITTGCQTTVGNYFANRGRDLGECFRIQAGVGIGLGVRARALGIVDIGVCKGVVPRRGGLGWVYGEAYAFGAGESGKLIDVEQVGLLGSGQTDGTDKLLNENRKWEPDVISYFLLPGLWSWFYKPPNNEGAAPLDDGEVAGKAGIDWPGVWIWSEAGRKRSPFGRVHAFDIEASVYAGIVFARAGFSPGEFVDFFLGWFGVDIAGDDVPLKVRESPVEVE